MKQAILGLVLVLAFGRTAAGATIIDFEGLGNPPTSPQDVDPPLLLDIATFTGGEVLNRAAPQAFSFVYSTANFCFGCTNPITISFASPVSNLSVLLTNFMTDSNVALSYTLMDNSTHSSTFNLLGGASTTLSLPFTGITSATVSSALVNNGWNFFIDNVTYDTTAVPEPGSLLLLASGLLGLKWVRRTRTSIRHR